MLHVREINGKSDIAKYVVVESVEECPKLENIIDNVPLLKKFIKYMTSKFETGKDDPTDKDDVLFYHKATSLGYISNLRTIGANKIVRFSNTGNGARTNGFVFSTCPSPTFNKYFDPYVEYVDVTPEMAYNMLLHHNGCNRKINLKRVLTYCKCILEGGWVLNSQGVSFYDNGMMADGQHRLLAILLSGKVIRLAISSGLNKDSKPYIDEGRARTIHDTSKVVGNDNFSSNELKTAVWMMDTRARIMKNSTQHYRKEQLSYAHKHIEAIRCVCDYTKPGTDPDRILSLALFRGALVRLSYNLDMYDDVCTDPKQRFDELMYVLTTGNTSNRDGDSAATKIREKKLSPKGRQEFSGNERANGYRKFEKACDMFMRSKTLTRWSVPKIKKELWLLPEESADQYDHICV
jgi:hypothetical protein